MDVHGAGVKDDAALADNPHRFSRYDGNSTRSVMNQHHFTSNGARPRSTSALTCKSSASSFISFALKAIRPVHFCETVDREQRNVSATSACVRPLSPMRRLTFSPTVGESTNSRSVFLSPTVRFVAVFGLEVRLVVGFLVVVFAVDFAAVLVVFVAAALAVVFAVAFVRGVALDDVASFI